MEQIIIFFIDLYQEKGSKCKKTELYKRQGKSISYYSWTNPEMNREAIRLIRSLPKWIPAKVKKHSVRMRYILPVKFGAGY